MPLLTLALGALHFPGTTEPPRRLTSKQQLPPPLDTHPWLERYEIVTKKAEDSSENTTEVYLLGVAHTSVKSAKNVQVLLERVNPDVVFVEICAERAGMLTCKKEDLRFSLINCIKYAYNLGLSIRHSLSLICQSYFLHLTQRNRLGSGGEMRTAFDYVTSQREISRPKFVLGDRPFSVTQVRANDLEKEPCADKSSETLVKELCGEPCPVPADSNGEMWDRAGAQIVTAWKQRTSLLDFFFQGFIENEDLMQSVNVLRPPSLENTKDRICVPERDVYMVCKLVQTCQEATPKRIVAVVGAGHVQGMAHLLNSKVIGTEKAPTDILAQLLSTKTFVYDQRSLKNLADHVYWFS